MELDLVSNLLIKPVASYGDHMHKHVNEMAGLWRESKPLPSKRFPVRILYLYVEYVARKFT